MTDSKVVTNVVDIQTGENKVAAPKRKPKGAHQGWAGLTPLEAGRPGANLLKLIYEEGFSHGLNITEIADEIGITYGYMAQLRNGARAIPRIRSEVLQRIATFLQVPKFTVLLAAEKIKLSDFYEPTTLEHSIEVALIDMSLDIEWAGIIPASLADSDSKIKLLTIRLYEEATGKKLMPFQIFPDDIAEFA
jgi:transcriptional regulator with XRE-family HTH domain